MNASQWLSVINLKISVCVHPKEGALSILLFIDFHDVFSIALVKKNGFLLIRVFAVRGKD